MNNSSSVLLQSDWQLLLPRTLLHWRLKQDRVHCVFPCALSHCPAKEFLSTISVGNMWIWQWVECFCTIARHLWNHDKWKGWRAVTRQANRRFDAPHPLWWRNRGYFLYILEMRWEDKIIITEHFERVANSVTILRLLVISVPWTMS